jgi:hypothetical protein
MEVPKDNMFNCTIRRQSRMMPLATKIIAITTNSTGYQVKVFDHEITAASNNQNTHKNLYLDGELTFGFLIQILNENTYDNIATSLTKEPFPPIQHSNW